MAAKQAYWIQNRSATAPGEVVELAVAAEQGGWDGVFVSDAVVEDHSEPLTLLAAVAAVTEHVSLGTWVVPLPARDVVAVARGAAVVDALSGGRLVLGIGLGNRSEHDALGVDRERIGARYDAAVEVLATLLAGGTVSRDDAWCSLEGVALNVACVQEPHPPILCAVQSENDAPLARAARWGGLMPFWAGIGEGRDPEIPVGAREQGLRDLLDRYRGHGGAGTVVVPRLARFGPDYDELCDELGVAWQLTCDELDAEALRGGPPR